MNKRDTFYYWYFLIHIPVTIVMDSTLVVPEQFQYDFQKYLINLHIDYNKDFLSLAPPFWLKIFVCFELFFQLPVFFLGPYYLRKNSKKILLAMMVYGFNAFATTLVCLVYILREGALNGLTESETWNLFAVYSPYFVIPLFMMFDCGNRVMKLLGKVKVE